MTRALAPLALCVLAAASAAAPPAGPFPAPLTLAGPGPYYTLRVPMALRSAAGRDDLGDLRVRNAAGEALPLAWLPERTESEAPQQAAATIYPVPVAPAPASAPPAPQRWIVDTHEPGFALERLALRLAAGSQGVYEVQVEAGDDLQRWRLVQAAAQLVQLSASGVREAGADGLQATEVELGDVAARYLRLTVAAGAPAPVLEAASVLRSRHRALEPAIDWSDPIAPASCDDRHCDYALPRNVPLERLQVVLAEPDTVGVLSVLVKVDAAAQPRRHHHLLRGSLHALRAKERTPPDAGWAWIAETEAWWLRNVGGAAELRSPPLRLDAGFAPMLRLQAAGPMRQLGRTPPALRIGAHAATLVFLARGPAPYRLERAPAEEPATAMPLAQLMPARRPDDPLPADTATPVVAVVAQAAPASAVAPAPAPKVPDNAPWLWAALLGGVALMGAMAWSLLRKR